MAMSAFDDFIQRQQSKNQAASSLDVDGQLNEWREYIATLYRTVESYMSGYLDSGQAALGFRQIEINEEFSGPYAIEQMSLTIGPSTILFKPIGTMLIGSKGRVDVQGPHGSARLLLVNKNISQARQLIRVSASSAGDALATAGKQQDEPVQWTWKLATPAPEMRFIDFNEQTFFNMILSIADA